MKIQIILSTLLCLSSVSATASTWLSLEGGYQKTAEDSSLEETSDKNGPYGLLSISRTWQIADTGLTAEPSLSFFFSSINGSTSCCGDGKISTQSLWFELPLLWQNENLGFHFRPGLMVGEDLNFNIQSTDKSKTALLSLGADVFHQLQWKEQDMRLGLKLSVLPADPATMMVGAFIQLNWESFFKNNNVGASNDHLKGLATK